MPLNTGSDNTWQPTASLQTLGLRAHMLTRVRAFFQRHGVLEVDTPVLSAAANPDPSVDYMTSRYVGPEAPRGVILYLHSSPEFPMKRLLAAGSGSIYQLCKVFRAGESGRLHHPEFTLLEWYRTGFDHYQLMSEVATLVTELLAEHVQLGPAERLSYRDAFRQYADIDPHHVTVGQLAARAVQHGIVQQGTALGRDAWLDLLLTHIVEPNLGQGRMTFLYDYPASQAALAQLRQDDPTVAERFELYINGMELANGFHELRAAGEQQRRFLADLAERKAVGLAPIALDHRLLRALEQGLPACAGVALGIERLLMIATGATDIKTVLTFPLERA